MAWAIDFKFGKSIVLNKGHLWIVYDQNLPILRGGNVGDEYDLCSRVLIVIVYIQKYRWIMDNKKYCSFTPHNFPI